MTKSLSEWQKLAHELAVKNGFYEHFNPTPDCIASKICLIHSELSEALEEVRLGPQDPMYTKPNGKPIGLGIELADVFLRLVDLCEALNIDLEQMVETKHEYNLTRPYKHGKKL